MKTKKKKIIKKEIKLSEDFLFSDVYEPIGKCLLEINVPSKEHYKCKLYFEENLIGESSYNIIKRGTFKKDGIVQPSMYVTENYNSINSSNQALPSSFRDYSKDFKIKDVMLTCVNPESNNYKFYKILPTSDFRMFEAFYGRIGANPGDFGFTRKVQNPYNIEQFWLRYYEKISKGYIDQSDVFLDSETLDKTKKEKVLSEDTLTNQVLEQLESFAFGYVTDNLVSNAVTKKQLSEAKKYLRAMRQRKTPTGFNNQYQKLLAVSPRKVKHVNLLLARSKSDFSKIISNEEMLLLAMEGVSQKGNSCNNEDIKIYVATKEQKDKVLQKLDPVLVQKVSAIYRVTSKKRQESFDNYLKCNDIDNVKELFHGSPNSTWKSILENGLLLNPDAEVTGKMLGHGIYFAAGNKKGAKKAWGYTSGFGSYWKNGTSHTSYLGLYAVPYGKPYIIDKQSKIKSYNESELKNMQCDCVHAIPSCGLRNEEICVFHENVLLNYLIKFQE